MRVVLVNRYAGPGGGAERHALGLARALRSAGHEVRFLSTQAQDNVEREGAFVPLSGADFWRRSPPLRERAQVAANAVYNRRAAAATRALIERFQPDVVHLHDLYPQLSAAPAAVAARLGVPVVQTLHNYELVSASPTDHRGSALDRGSAPPATRALRTALHPLRRMLHVPSVSLWIAVSRYVAAAYARHGIHAEVLANFVSPSRHSEQAPFDGREGIAFFGRLAEEKGVADVVELARRLPDVPVTIAGWGALEEHVQGAARELGNLEYAGLLDPDAIARLGRAARLVVIPSRWQEPAGLVALEAMAEGTPVVAYSNGGLAEYVRDAGGGLAVAAEVEQLVRASRRLYDDRGTWERLSATGRRAVDRGHSPERYVERLESLYAGLLGSRTGY